MNSKAYEYSRNSKSEAVPVHSDSQEIGDTNNSKRDSKSESICSRESVASSSQRESVTGKSRESITNEKAETLETPIVAQIRVTNVSDGGESLQIATNAAIGTATTIISSEQTNVVDNIITGGFFVIKQPI